MISIVEIVIAILGLFALFTGRLYFGWRRAVRGLPARLLGLVALAPFPLAFTLGYAIGTVARSAMPWELVRMPDGTVARLQTGAIDPSGVLMETLRYVEAGLVIYCTVFVLGVGYLASAPPMVGKAASDRHSTLGIASFVHATVAAMVVCIVVAIVVVLETTTPNGFDGYSPQALPLVVALFVGLFVDVVGLGLGLAGLYVGGQKKRFAFWGVDIGILVLVGFLILVAVYRLTA